MWNIINSYRITNRHLEIWNEERVEVVVRLLTLKAKGCRMFPCTVVDSRMTDVSGQYWYQFTLMLWLFSSFRLRLSGNTWAETSNTARPRYTWYNNVIYIWLWTDVSQNVLFFPPRFSFHVKMKEFRKIILPRCFIPDSSQILSTSGKANLDQCWYNEQSHMKPAGESNLTF